MVEAKDIKHPIEPGDCILFATADWDEPYWTNKQHCAKELTRLGWRVLYVESVGLRAPKAGSKKDLKRLWLRLRKGLHGLFFGAVNRDKNLWVLSPLVVPGAHSRTWFGRVNQYLLEWSLRRHVQSKTFAKPLIWTYHPFMLGAIGSLNHGPLLYHCVDDLTALPGIDQLAFRKAEFELLKISDIVFATTESLAEKCRVTNPNTHFLPNVVDAEHFSKALDAGSLPEDLRKIPEPRLVYHGVLSDFKIDFDLLYEAALLRPEWHWVLIGEEREGQQSEVLSRLRELRNIHCLGYKPYKDLPQYLRGMNVGLLPTLLNDYTRSMFPMKYFEYIAAGLPVVSTPLAFTAEVDVNIAVAGTASEFVKLIDKILETGKLSRNTIKKIINNNTWRERTKKMLGGLID